MRLVIAHPTGNQNVRSAVAGMLDAGIVPEFHTTIATFPDSMLQRLAACKYFSALRRRQFDRSLKLFTLTRPWLEVARLLSLKCGLDFAVRHEHGPCCIDAVYQDLDRHVSRTLRMHRDEIDGIYAYEDGAVRSFMEARAHGMRCFYDLPVGYWRAAQAVFEQEKERWPQWIDTLPGLRDSPGKLERKDAEIRYADRIFVASRFTAQTLDRFPGVLPPVEIIPYGFPPVRGRREYVGSARDEKLKLLFVGGLTQRKGIAYLFKAVEALQSHVSLTLVGRLPEGRCEPLTHELSKHRWIKSLPHDDVLALMRQHDVLVFPSLFEGFGLVITEAMSQGTPVITTERTAGPDLITPGENGWLIEAGSSEALQSAIEDLLQNRKRIKDAGLAAMESARCRPWTVYGRELAQSLLQKSPPSSTAGVQRSTLYMERT